ncbi:HTH domain-containing protein [Pedobacter psychrodurus]|uniref:HTH domain-containing protein n=1 Tax=Pedobacter psychrodurus TaxID=2530456 RepID=UPI00292D63D0|nr:HTH domain-containing protein [Pedobacter psychrodurus]
MSIIAHREKLQRMLFMVRHNRLKTAKQAAAQLSCSERTIKNYLSKLRDSGHEIRYDRSLGRYTIKENF